MNTQEKIEAAGKKKEEGNALFKAGKYERASKRYEKVNSIVMKWYGLSIEILNPCMANLMRSLLLSRQLNSLNTIPLLVRKRNNRVRC